MLNLDQSLAVQRVKERVAHTLFGAQAAQQTYFGPVYPVRSLHTKLGASTQLRAQLDAASMQQTIAQSQERERQQLEAGDEERRTVRSGTGNRPMIRPARTSAHTNGWRIQWSTPGIWGVNFLISSRISRRSPYRKMPQWCGGKRGSIRI